MGVWRRIGFCSVLFALLLSLLSFLSCAEDHAPLQAGALVCRLDATGHLSSLMDATTNTEYLAAGQPAPLLSVCVADEWIAPSRLEIAAPNSLLLRFGGTNTGDADADHAEITVSLHTLSRETHLVLEVIAAEPDSVVDALRWGPFPVAIGDTVGEIVGVVRNRDFAFGLQALNAKTIGGALENDEGSILSRGTAAQKTEFGAMLNAFSLDRSRPRTHTVWKEWRDRFPRLPVPPIPGETVVGSKIALFGCPPGSVLDVIGTIEITEGLPHPEIDGVWSKRSPETGRSYLIASFSEANIDTLLDVVSRAGLLTLYHFEPFASWGHFAPNPEFFPGGIDGVRRCVEKAAARDIRIGAHTLTSFTTPNDPFVTPVPDPRLAETGRSYLTAGIDANETSIAVADTFYFVNELDNTLYCVRIEEELIQYGGVSRERPFQLLDCVRGAFGTTAAAHEKGRPVGKLLDYPYKVFFPNWGLQDELIANLAAFFNATGVSQMDFDGHEGCYATGQGQYAMEYFAERFYQLTDHTVVNGSSRSSHYYWHVCHYLNWGEPWYEGFRESMQQYRIDNQALLERNYLPNMLGWYLLKAHTTLADMEWMLARAAGYGAGFALATSMEAVRGNPALGEILDTIREWETARRCGAFSTGQRERFRDPAREFRLTPTGDPPGTPAARGGWQLYPIETAGPFVHEGVLDAQGVPATATWRWTQMAPAGPLRFVLRTSARTGDDATGIDDTGADKTAAVTDPILVFDGEHRLELPVRLEPGQSVACDGKPEVRIYDTKGRYLETVALGSTLPVLVPGEHEVAYTCTAMGDPVPRISLAINAVGNPEPVRRPVRQ